MTTTTKPYKFFWTRQIYEDAQRINKPRIKNEGPNEDRTRETATIIADYDGKKEWDTADMINIQTLLLKENNWKRITPGLRRLNLAGHPDAHVIESELNNLFPVIYFQDNEQPIVKHRETEGTLNVIHGKDEMLQWYTNCMMLKPFSDLNSTVFGIIVAVLYRS